VSSNWKSYFCNVNAELASIALDLALRNVLSVPDKPWLLWVWVYLKSPRPDGLSDQSEFDTICAIEDELAKQIGELCAGIYAGRITTQGRRELYFYGATRDQFKKAVKTAMARFPAYKYDFDSQHEPDWNQYLNVLWPSEESQQRMANPWTCSGSWLNTVTTPPCPATSPTGSSSPPRPIGSAINRSPAILGTASTNTTASTPNALTH